ncbi:MAG: DsrE family protein [Planctomycetes bacterium]|nr:DsrE family protein [Planctomycetota bacterium]
MIEKGLVCIIKSNCLGSGNDEIGTLLMQKFFAMTAEQKTLPEVFAFVNTGVKLLEDEDVLARMKELQAQGCKFIFCGTCINFFKLQDKVNAGIIGNMAQIQELLFTAKRTVCV